MKLKRLPSMRTGKRYMVFRIISEKGLPYEEIRNAVHNALLGWLGESGFARAGCRIVKNLFDEKEQVCWMSCSTGSIDAVRTALALLHQIGDQRVIVHVLRVSGTIKSAKEKLGKGG
jgi:ribonuclease P/MRP protein subunit POP5